MNIHILLIVLLDYFKYKDQYPDLDSFLNENYTDRFIKDFYEEYNKLNIKVSDDMTAHDQNRGKYDIKDQNEVSFEYT